MRHKFLLTFIVSFSLLILLTGTSKAVVQDDPVKNGTGYGQEIKKENRGFVDKIRERIIGRDGETPKKKCEVLQDRIELKATQFDKNKQGHLVAYNNAADRLQKFITKYDDLGYDVTKLEADLIALKTKIATFDTHRNTYVTALRAAKQRACTETPEEYNTQITAVKVALAQLKTDAADIKTFFQTDIKPHLMEIRAQIEEKADDSEEE